MLLNDYLIISELPRRNVPVRGGRRRCDDFPAIDIRHPRHRELIDQPGSRISWWWNRNGQLFCNIDMVFHPDHVVLTDVTDQTQPQTLSISLLRTPCHYGGTRPWFGCPGCGCRSAKLYFGDGSVLCRSCLGLAYRSQLQASAERPRLIAQRIRRSLSGSGNLFVPFPAKPPTMLWRTYDRIREKGERFEARAMARIAACFKEASDLPDRAAMPAPPKA
jgi:hypothetical protein